MTNQDSEQREDKITDPHSEEPAEQERRKFLRSLGKWSQAVIGGVLVGGTLTPSEPAQAWNNSGVTVPVTPEGRDWYYRGDGGNWGNRGGSWVNRGGGWVNRGGSWVNRGGGWYNRGGGWYNRGSGWVNRRPPGGWYNRRPHPGWHNRGGGWYNRRPGWSEKSWYNR